MSEGLCLLAPRQLALPSPLPSSPSVGAFILIVKDAQGPNALPAPSPSLGGHSSNVPCCKKVSLTPQIWRLSYRILSLISKCACQIEYLLC